MTVANVQVGWMGVMVNFHLLVQYCGEPFQYYRTCAIYCGKSNEPVALILGNRLPCQTQQKKTATTKTYLGTASPRCARGFAVVGRRYSPGRPTVRRNPRGTFDRRAQTSPCYPGCRRRRRPRFVACPDYCRAPANSSKNPNSALLCIISAQTTETRCGREGKYGALGIPVHN